MERYLIPLILTIIIETFVVYMLGFRSKKFLWSVVMVNVITNPALNFLLSQTVDLYLSFGMNYILILEAIVVVVEYLILKTLFRQEKIPFFQLSFVMNGSSFLLGLLLLW
jgi:hypothetical protein